MRLGWMCCEYLRPIKSPALRRRTGEGSFVEEVTDLPSGGGTGEKGLDKYRDREHCNTSFHGVHVDELVEAKPIERRAGETRMWCHAHTEHLLS